MDAVTHRLGAALLIAFAAWLGGVAFFSFFVAPAAFRVLPSPALAGALVGETLPALFITGAFVGAAGLTLFVWLGRSLVASRLPAIGAALVMVVSTLSGQFVFGARIAELRERSPVPIDALSVDHPLRQEFGRLHGYSVIALGLAALAALVVIWLLLSARRRGLTADA